MAKTQEPGPDDKPTSLSDDLAGSIAKAKEAGQREKVESAMSKAPIGSIVRYSLVIILLLVSFGMIVHSVSGAGSHDSNSQANLKTIEELRKDLADSKSRKDDQVDADSLRQSLDSASRKGSDLESIQSDMASLDFGAKDLDQVLADFTELTDEARGYFTVGALSGGDFLPQARWFQPYEPGKNSQGKDAWVQLGKDKWSWKFEPTKTVDDDGNIAGIWTARMTGGETDGQLLCWVSGWFNPRKAQWFGLQRGITHLGNKYAGVSTSTSEFDGDEGTKISPAPSEQELIEKAGKSSGTSTDPSASPSESSAPSSSSSPAPKGDN